MNSSLSFAVHITLAATLTGIAQDSAPLTKEIAIAHAYHGKHGRIPGNIPAVHFDEGAEGVAFRIEFDGVDKTGEINAPNTGKWYGFKTARKEAIPLTKGWHTMRVVFTRGEHAMNLADLRFVPIELPFVK